MTENRQFVIPNSRAQLFFTSMSPGNVAFCVMSVFALALTVCHSEIAIEGMTRGLKLCATSLIPSLFPFMVISSLIASSGAAEVLGRLLARPVGALFGISGSGCCAVLLGLICGFPVGTKTALTLYENGKISRRELEHLLMLSNLPSSAFLINAVGITLFGDKSFGITLYIINIISTIAIGLISKPFFKKETFNAKLEGKKKKQSGIALFTHAITDSAISMLYVCAFVVFFSALVGSLEAIVSPLSLPDIFSPLWFGFFELTQGMVQSSLCLDRGIGMLSAAIVSGWSGLSVHFQIMSICQSHTLSFRPYFISKAATALLNAALFTLLSLML